MFPNKWTTIILICLIVFTASLAQPYLGNHVYAQTPIQYSKTLPLNGAILNLPATTYQLLQWGNTNIASTDRYQYCIDETNNSQCDAENWITRDSVYSGGPAEFAVTAGHTYYWQVRTKDDKVYADTGTWWTFSIQPESPFVKISPSNGAHIQMPSTTHQLLQWSGAKDSADRFQYCLDETNNSLCDNNNWITRDSLYSGGPGEFTLTAGHTYYWQVRLRDAGTNANSGIWWSFTVEPVSLFTKISPPNETIISLPTTTYQLLQWTDPSKSNTDKYQYCIDQTNNSQCDNNNWITRDSLYSGGPGEFALVEGHTYYWQARLRDAQTYANNGAWWSLTIKPSKPSVIKIIRTSANPTLSSNIGFAVTFSESVTGVNAADFVLSTNVTGTSISSVFGTANLYIVSVGTGSGSGTIRLDLVDDDSIVNMFGEKLGGAGTGNGNFTAGELYTVDKTAPALTSIIRADASSSNAASVRFAVTFSESVTGVDLADFSLATSAGATLNSISGSGAIYMLTATTGTGNDTLRLDFLDNDTVIDLAGNSTSAGYVNGETYTIDRASPIATNIILTSQPNSPIAVYAISFSESVSGVDASDFQLSTQNGAVITNTAGSGNLYTVSISLKPGSDTIQLRLQDNDSIVDGMGNMLGGQGLGNGNLSGGSAIFTINVPTVTSIVRASPNPTNAQSVNFIVTFSEPVTGVDSSDFQTTNGTLGTVNNQNPFYIVTVIPSSTDGTLKLDLVDNDSIQNNQGVSLGGAGSGNANFLLGESFTIDRTAPQVTSIIRAGGNPAINPSADFIVTFSESVTGVETSDFIVLQSNVIKSAVTSLQNANPFYWVVVQTGAGSGTIRLDLLDNGNIADLAGNKLVNVNFKSGESFNLAKTTEDFAAPSLSTPSGSEVNNPLLAFSWSPVQNAQAYEYFIARDSAFLQTVMAQTVAETTTQVQVQLPDGTYYIHVRAYNPGLNPGKFSSTISITLDKTPPVVPRLLSPKNNSAAPIRPWLRWSISSDAVQYQVEVDNDADFSSPAFSAITSNTSIQTNALQRKIYYWRVRAKDAAGNWSNWSSVFTLNTR